MASSKSGLQKVDYNLIVDRLQVCCNGAAAGLQQQDDEVDDGTLETVHRDSETATETTRTAVASDNDDVIAVIPLSAYLEAFRQLHTFFCAMGKIFEIVASEISTKVGVLECYLQDADVGDHYTDVHRMLEYESTHGLLRNTKRPSGSRTLLRLHRGLEFVCALLERIIDLPPDQNIASKATEAYKTTLGRHHSWGVYCAMLVALKTLSSTKDLVKRTTDLSVDEFRTRTVPNILRVGKRTHRLVQGMYADKGCLELP